MKKSIPIAVVLLLILPTGIGAQPPTLPYLFNYQIQFPEPPRDDNEAIATFPSRARIVIDTLACSTDFAFYQSAFNKNDGKNFPRADDNPCQWWK